MCKLIAETSKMIQIPDPTFIVQETMVAYASFNASVIAGSCFDLKFIVTRALELDNVLQGFFANAHSRRGYETVFTGVDSDNYGG